MGVRDVLQRVALADLDPHDAPADHLEELAGRALEVCAPGNVVKQDRPRQEQRAALRELERVRIDASEIIHWFIEYRPGQTRGVSDFAPVLFDIKMLGKSSEAMYCAGRAVGALSRRQA